MTYFDEDMGTVTIGGRLDTPPALVCTQVYNFTIDGTERKATVAAPST
jgi:hypothetical protein